MSKVQAFNHIVFCTKSREMTIPEGAKEDVYRFIWKEITSMKCKLLRIGGIGNHIHILLELHPTIALASLIQNIKAKSSGWMNSDRRFPNFKGWSIGYFGATISNDGKSHVIDYIKSQPEHHSATSLDDELKHLCTWAGMEYDERDF